MTAATAPFPEAELRAVLSAAVAAWARAPAAADARSAEGAPRRVYVDAFAGAELQFGTGVVREAGEPTRAYAAIRALDEAGEGSPSSIALFVEEDPAHLQRIYAELEDAAGGERLRATRDFASLAEGEASLVEAPFASVAAEVARFAAGARAFFWLAPATARALPWSAVEPLLAVAGATLLIRFPHADFEKQSRHVGALADLPGFARRIVEGCSALLGDGKHAWLPAWRTDARDGTTAALSGVLERFRTLLAGAAGERTVMPIELEAAEGARAWCFLVTADAAVARAVAGNADEVAAADRVAPDAAPEPVPDVPAAGPPPAKPSVPEIAAADATAPIPSPERVPVPARSRRKRPEPRVATPSPSPEPEPISADLEQELPVAEVATPNPSPESEPISAEPEREAPAVEVAAPIPDTEPVPVAATPEREAPAVEVLDLFPEDIAPRHSAPARHDPALAAELESRFGACTATWGEVQASFAASGVTAEALKAALRHLQRGGRAVYPALRRDADEIVFPPEPVAPARAASRRKAATDDGFFGTDE